MKVAMKLKLKFKVYNDRSDCIVHLQFFSLFFLFVISNKNIAQEIETKQ